MHSNRSGNFFFDPCLFDDMGQDVDENEDDINVISQGIEVSVSYTDILPSETALEPEQGGPRPPILATTESHSPTTVRMKKKKVSLSRQTEK